jgi:hypothetical protein
MAFFGIARLTLWTRLGIVRNPANAGQVLSYSTTNEVAGTGYTAGGIQLTGVTVNSSGYTAYVNFNDANFGAAVTARCALIYNASKANRSVAVLDFGSDKTSTSFKITMPANSPTTALIRTS